MKSNFLEKKDLNPWFLIFLFAINLNSQIDSSSVYNDLEVVKFYSVSTSSSTQGGKARYKVNDKGVNKSTYDKYHNAFMDMMDCCPCILKTYDEKEVLLSESISCGDCKVGYYKEFYPNGKLKIHGEYKENPTGNWNDILKRGYCYMLDGKWLYYNIHGHINYIEIWEDGNFIEQRPKGKEVEIWKVDLSLNGVEVDTQKVALKDFHKLKFTPQYKNLNESDDLVLKLNVSAVGFKIIRKEVEKDEFEKVEIQELIKKVGTSEVEKISVQIGVYYKGKIIQTFFIKLSE